MACGNGDVIIGFAGGNGGERGWGRAGNMLMYGGKVAMLMKAEGREGGKEGGVRLSCAPRRPPHNDFFV